MSPRPKYIPAKNSQLIFIICLIALTAKNIPGLQKEIARIDGFQRQMDHQVIGQYFLDLKQYVRNLEIMGYYTDADIKTDEGAAKDFAHAQFILSPTVLDLNALNHEYVFFNCKDPRRALFMIKTLGLIPLKGNATGMILAKHP